MKEISQNVVIILLVVLVIFSAIGIWLNLASIQQVLTIEESSTSGKVSLYVLPKPSTSRGQVFLEVVNQTTE